MLKNKVGSFGVVKNTKIDVNFDNFKISQGASLNGEPTIIVGKGYAVGYDSGSKEIEVIKNEWVNPIIFPQDGKYYWVKIEPQVDTLEKGVCSIDVNGNLVGVGTEFTRILRGQPNFPQVIRFYRLDKTDNYTKIQSALNPLEYTVAQVIDDQNVILQGSFNNENSLYYEVVGTFTPGYIVPNTDKGIYRKNGCKISLVQETSPTSAPNKPNHIVDKEFFIYRIKYENGQMKIEDFRNEIFKLDSEFDIEYISNLPIPNIGLTKVEFSQGSVKEVNNATVEWGFFSDSYDIFPGNGKITLLNGSGGKFKTSNDFQNGNFDGFRLYVLDYIKNDLNDDYYSSFEKIYKIRSSQKNGTAIDLILDNFSPLDFIPENYSSGVNYTCGQKVTTSLGTHKLVVASLSSISPVQPVYNNGTIYSVNQFVTYLNGTYRSLTNSNSGNAPDANPTFWELVWENYKSRIVVVPDCEEVILHAKVGDDLTDIVDTAGITGACGCTASPVDKIKSSYEQNHSYPAIFGRGVIPLLALNAEGTSKQDDLVYNIQYRTKNNKAISSRKVLPSDAVGYTDELGTAVSYNTDLIDNAFVKSIRSADSYQDFKDRIDTGDRLGWENIDDLEVNAAALAGRIIPIKVGTNKQRIIIKDSTKLTADIWIDLDVTLSKSGNEFEFHFEKFIDEDQQYKVNFIQGGLTGNILLQLGKELRQGDYIARFKYDKDELSWQVIKELNSFRGYNHFIPSNENFVLNTSVAGNTELAPDGQRVLVIEGDRNVIAINDDAGYGSFAYIKVKNGLPISELYLSKYGGSNNINLIKDGAEARDNNANIGSTEYFAFNSSANHGTNGTYFTTLTLDKVVHLVLGKKGWWGSERQGYYLQADSNIPLQLNNISAQLNPIGVSLGIGGEISVPSGVEYPGDTIWHRHTQHSLPNDGKNYYILLFGTQMHRFDDDNKTGWYRIKGRMLFDGNVVHNSYFGNDSSGSDKFDSWEHTHSHTWIGAITATGQKIALEANSENTNDFKVYLVKMNYILIPRP